MPTPYPGLPYIAQGQAQKEIAHNEALNLLDAVVQLAVKGRTTVNLPVAPAEGGRWIIPQGATGAWAGQTNKVHLVVVSFAKGQSARRPLRTVREQLSQTFRAIRGGTGHRHPDGRSDSRALA